MADLPAETIETAERLTRLARSAVDDDEAAAYRRERDRLLAEYGYVARVREEDATATLVCYPDEWVEDGTVLTDRIEHIDRAVERPLEGPEEEADYGRIEAYNREIARAVEAAAGPVHGATAHAFADFMGNHYVRRVDSASAVELREFTKEYFPRNAWPSEEQCDRLEESLRLVYETAGSPVPPELDEAVDPGTAEGDLRREG